MKKKSTPPRRGARWWLNQDYQPLFPQPGPVRNVLDILRNGFPDVGEEPRSQVEGLYYLAREAQGSESASEHLRGIVTAHLYRGEALPPPLAEWVILQLHHRPPVVPDKPKHRTRSMDQVDAMTRFAARWAKIRHVYATDDEALQVLTVEFHRSHDALKRWLYDPYTQGLIERLTR